MLTRIRRIKGLGVFGDFTADQNLPDFARYNLVYGSNGSGKTTLSRLFSALEAGAHPEFSGLEYGCDTQRGPIKNGQAYGRKVRVFNSDYIEANIGQFHTPLRHILIVGEENKALAEEAANERIAHEARERDIAAARTKKSKLETDRGKVFSAIAKTIGEATSGMSLRSYRKPDAEAAFTSEAGLAPLTEEDLDSHRATVHQEQLESLSLPEWPNTEGGFRVRCEALARTTAELLTRTAQAGALRRLTEEPEIAAWVEAGLTLHRAHTSENCEFCAQPLPLARMKLLAEHFGVEDQNLKAEIESAISQEKILFQELAALSHTSRTELYSELRPAYDASVERLEECRSALAHQFSTLEGALGEKLLQRSVPLVRNVPIDPGPVEEALLQIGQIITKHNEKTAAFEQARSTARAKIERHYLSTIKNQIDDFDAQIDNQQAIIERLTEGAADLPDTRSLAELKDSYESKQSKVSSAHAGGAELTKMLHTFIGRTELTFESSSEGYRVLRRGQAAKRLSEGERTAVAFLYFIVQLQDQDFTLSDGLVVIDDPISSLDATSIYQAFAFLKNAVQDAAQVFILTHNFDFLKLLLNWAYNLKRADRAYFMIVCMESELARDARLQPLDKLLHDHPTEYCYLFKLLYGFKSDGTIMAAYHIPNVARKVLESFLEFQRPQEASLHAKLNAIGFDPLKKTAIYKFANDLSHFTGKGFDPALVAETQKNVTYLLEMVQSVAPDHYAGLEYLALR